jgi:hypothetical protein
MCYSALAYLLLLSAGSPGHVEREDVRRMVNVTPVRRLHAIADRSEDAVVRGQIEHLLDLYASFLETTDAPKQVLIDQFSIETFRRERFEQATKFGDAVFELMRRLGERSALYRYVVV